MPAYMRRTSSARNLRVRGAMLARRPGLPSARSVRATAPAAPRRAPSPRRGARLGCPRGRGSSPGSPVEVLEGPPDRGHSGHALFDDVERRQGRAEAQQDGRAPQVRVRGYAGKSGERQREHRPAHRNQGPPAKPEELLPPGVVLGPREQAGGAENPRAYLEVPAVVLLAAEHAGPFGPQACFERPQPLV